MPNKVRTIQNYESHTFFNNQTEHLQMLFFVLSPSPTKTITVHYTSDILFINPLVTYIGVDTFLPHKDFLQAALIFYLWGRVT